MDKFVSGISISILPHLGRRSIPRLCRCNKTSALELKTERTERAHTLPHSLTTMRGSYNPSTEAIDGRISDKQSMSRLGTTFVDDSSRVDEEDGNSHSFWKQLLSFFTPNSMFLKDYIIGAKNLIYCETDPNAWPPPTLLLLAALTLFALLVHPDGFTWILVGKLR